jgi:hypothetical protein
MSFASETMTLPSAGQPHMHERLPSYLPGYLPISVCMRTNCAT